MERYGWVDGEYVLIEITDDRDLEDTRDEMLDDLEKAENEMLAFSDRELERLDRPGRQRGPRGNRQEVRAERADILQVFDTIRDAVEDATTLAELDAVDRMPVEQLKRRYHFGRRSHLLEDFVDENGQPRTRRPRAGRNRRPRGNGPGGGNRR
jgi:hypothetical protein